MKYCPPTRLRSLIPLSTALLLLPACLPPVRGQETVGAATTALTLNQATTTALTVNPATRVARQQLAQAQARVTQAQAQRRFQITFNSTISGSNASVYQPPPSEETFGTLQNTLTVPLPLGAKPRLAVEQAQQQLAAAQAQYRAARYALVGQVSAAYYNLLRQQALLAIAQQTLAQAQRALSDAEKRNRAGDVAQLDVLQAQVPVASAQAGVYQAQNAIAVAQQTLNDLIGHDLDAPLSVADVPPTATVIPYTLEQARTLALQVSPDVQAAEATVRADQAALKSARLYREPAVSLQAIDLRSKDITSFSREDTLQASITVPLSDGGLGQGQVREAQAALAQAQAQADVSRRAALVTVSAAYLTARSSQRQVTAARTTLDVAQISYDKTVQGYQNGLFPLVNVLNAQAALTQARIAYTQAIYDAAVAVGQFNAAINGGATAFGPGVGAPAASPAPAPQGVTSPGTPSPGSTNPSGTSPAGASTPGNTPSGNSTAAPGTTGKGTP